MAIIGISLLVASVVLFCLRPPAWLPNLLANLTQRRVAGSAPRPSPVEQPEDENEDPNAEEADVIHGSEEPKVVSVSPPPPIIIQEPLVEIEVTDTSEHDMESVVVQTKDSRAGDIREGNTLDEEDDVEQEEQSTPKATAIPRDDPVPSLVLPKLSIPTESSEDNVPQQPPPSFTMTPPPEVNIEPEIEKEVDAVMAQQTPPPKSNTVAPIQQPAPTLNFVSPEQTSPPTVSPSRQNSIPVPSSTKSASDLMPPPPRPQPKITKPRTSGIPLPASISSPVRRIPSLSTARPLSPTPSPSRIPSPPSATRNISPTTTRSPTTTNGITPAPAPATPAPAPAPAPALANRIPTLSGLPRRASPTTSNPRNLPIPRRGAPSSSSSSSSSGLMPPPTATSIPKKPTRQVSLAPGHSPLDWARLAQSPTSDLRNLPAHTPYLRVTPSMLAQHNGRKGRDAWSVFGSDRRVYNVTPYIAFHPGGGPELLRGAGKDGTRLFAEVHPWVNYETMLQSCLIGLLVEEGDGDAGAMEEMD